jgi:FkbM family methyltransferase
MAINMYIKKQRTRLSYFFWARRYSYVESTLCGVELNVLKGTLRAKTDQDDAWWFYLSKHHHVIFDIGCNIGYTALLALIQNPNKRMILVDPNPEALKRAAMTIIENNLGSSLSYMSAFVGETVDETVKFYTVGSGAAGSMYASHAVTAASNNMFLNVKTVTLDYLYSFYQLQPDLIKIDVEGAETLVMKGAKTIAKETRCTFFIEMHNVEGLGMENATQLMIDWAKEMDYSVWYLKTKTVLTTPELVKNRGKCHLLLMPNDKAFPDYLNAIPQSAPLPKTLL